MDIIESLETLIRLNLKSSDSKENEKKIECMKSIDTKLKLEVFKEEFPSLLCFSVLTLLRTLQDNDMNVWSFAEQVLNKIVKTFYHDYSQEILTEVWRAMKGTKIELKDYSYSTISIVHEGRSRRYALQLFSMYTISPVINDREFKRNLTITLADLCSINDQFLIETLSEEMGSIIKKYLYDAVKEDFKILIVTLIKNVRSPQNKIKSASIKSLIDICQYGPMEYNFIIKIFNNIMRFLFPNINEKINIDYIEKNMSSLFENIKSEDPNLFGILHFMCRFFKFTHENSLDIDISKHVSFSLLLCVNILENINDDSLISECLRLIEVIFTYYINILKEIKFNEKLNCILDKFHKILFDRHSNDISKVLVLLNMSHLMKHKVEDFITYIRGNLTEILELRKNYDPLISGNVYNFIGYLIEYFLISNGKIEWEEFNPLEYLQLLLESVFKEASSVVSKNIIISLFNLIPYLFESKFFDFVPYMINYLLCLPNDSNRIVKIEIISSISKLDMKLLRLINNSKLLNQYTDIYNSQIENVDIQTKVLNFILGFLDDSDHSVRNEACNSLLRLLPNLDTNIKYRKSHSSFYNILDLQSSYYYSSLYNNCWKEQIDNLLMPIIQRLYTEDSESNFMKGIYYLLSRMYENGFDIIPTFVPLFLDQISCNNITVDLEAQLNIIKLLSYSFVHLNGHLLIHRTSVFNHILLVMNILLIIVKKHDYHKDNIHFDDIQDYFEKFPYYTQLYSRLEDAYNLSLTTFKDNIFDQFCHETLKAIERMIPSLSKMSIYFLNRVFLFAETFYRRNPEEIMDLLDELFYYINVKSYLPPVNSPNTNFIEKEKYKKNISDLFITDSRIFDPSFLTQIQSDKLLPFIYKESKEELFNRNERKWRRLFKPFKPSKSPHLVRRLDYITHKILTELIVKSIDHKLVGRAVYFLIRMEGLCPSGMTFLNDQFVSQFHEKLLKTLKLILIKQSKDVGLFHKDIIIPAIALSFELYIKTRIPTIRIQNLEFNDYVDLIPHIFKYSWDSNENMDSMNHIIYSLFHHIETDHPKGEFESTVLVQMKTEFIKNLCKRLYNPRAVYYLNRIIDYVNDYSISRYEYYLSIISNYIIELLTSNTFLLRMSSLPIQKFYKTFNFISKLPRRLIDISKILYHFYDEQDDAKLRIIRLIFVLRFAEIVYTKNPTNSISNNDSLSISLLLFESLYHASKDIISSNYSDHYTRIFCLYLLSIRQILKIDKFKEVSTNMSKLIEKNEDNKTIDIILGVLSSKYSAACYLFVDILNKMMCYGALKSLSGIIKEIQPRWKQQSLQLVVHSKLCNILYKLGETINFRNDKDLLDILSNCIEDKNIRNIIVSNEKYYSHILGYIKKKMIISHESLTREEEHKLLLFLTSLNPTKDTLKAVFRYFFSSKYISVVLSSEKYVLKLFNMKGKDAESMIKLLITVIKENLIFIRPTFLKRINENLSKEDQINSDLNEREDLADYIINVFKSSNVQSKDVVVYANNLFQEIIRRIKDSILNNTNCSSWSSIVEELDDENEDAMIPKTDGIHQCWMFMRKCIEAVSLLLSHGMKDVLESFSYKLPISVSMVIFSMINFSLQTILHINETTSSMSAICISRLLHLMKQYISMYPLDEISKLSQFTLFIDGLYKLKILLFGHSKLSLTKRDISITEKYQELWNIQLNKPFMKSFENIEFLNSMTRKFCKVILVLIASLFEIDIFPHLDHPINFDHVDDPNHIIVQYIYLINQNIPSNPKNIKKIWDHLFLNIKSNPNITNGITSDKLNALTIRALTSLLLRMYYKQLDVKNYRYLNLPLLKISTLRENIMNHKKNPLIDQLVDELIPILKSHLLEYINYKTTNIHSAKESIKSVALLCELFNTQRFLVFHEILMDYLDHGERYYDDPIISNYLILCISKYVSITWNFTKTSLHRKQNVIKQLHELFGQFIALCIPLRRRDPEMYFPISKIFIFLSLNYIIQSKVIVINSKTNILLYIWIKMFIEPKLSSQVMKYEFNTDVRFLDSSKNPSPLLKYLALDLIQTSDDDKALDET